MIVKMLAKKMLGVKYESVLKNILLVIFLCISLSFIGVSLKVSFHVLLFANFFFTLSVVMQVLGSADNAKYMKNMFMMPFSNKSFCLSYFAVISAYILLTKTSLLWVLYISFTDIEFIDIILIIFGFFNACLSGMLIFSYKRRKNPVAIIFIAVVGLAICWLIPDKIICLICLCVLTLLYLVLVSRTDGYYFMIFKNNTLASRHEKGKNHFLVFKYIFRYLLSNKSYLINTVAILAFGCFFAKTLMSESGIDFLPIGMAIVSINTPLAIILSGSRQLRKRMSALPNQFRTFLLPYGIVLFIFQLIVYSIYLLALFILGAEISLYLIIIAILFALQSAALVLYLEVKHPILKWKVESDLWHHPRKYIIPVVLLIETTLIELVKSLV